MIWIRINFAVFLIWAIVVGVNTFLILFSTTISVSLLSSVFLFFCTSFRQSSPLQVHWFCSVEARECLSVCSASTCGSCICPLSPTLIRIKTLSSSLKRYKAVVCYTVILQRLATDVHSVVTAKTNAASWQQERAKRCISDGADSNVTAQLSTPLSHNYHYFQCHTCLQLSPPWHYCGQHCDSSVNLNRCACAVGFLSCVIDCYKSL